MTPFGSLLKIIAQSAPSVRYRGGSLIFLNFTWLTAFIIHPVSKKGPCQVPDLSFLISPVTLLGVEMHVKTFGNVNQFFFSYYPSSILIWKLKQSLSWNFFYETGKILSQSRNNNKQMSEIKTTTRRKCTKLSLVSCQTYGTWADSTCEVIQFLWWLKRKLTPRSIFVLLFIGGIIQVSRHYFKFRYCQWLLSKDVKVKWFKQYLPVNCLFWPITNDSLCQDWRTFSTTVILLTNVISFRCHPVTRVYAAVKLHGAPNRETDKTWNCVKMVCCKCDIDKEPVLLFSVDDE